MTLSEQVGACRNAFIGYSKDEEVKNSCSSGGLVSALLIELLRKKIIDAALLCRTKLDGNGLGYEILLAKNRAEVLSCASSKYFDIPVLEGLKLVRKFKGKVAVVGLPCQIAAISRLCNSDRSLKNKIRLKLGLFCSHITDKKLTEKFLKRRGCEASGLKKFVFRNGPWRGRMKIEKKSGETVSLPYFDFGKYMGLWFLSRRKCFYCRDHFSENADVSFGDLWLWKFKNKKRCHSAVLVRTGEGERCFNLLQKKDNAKIKETTVRLIFDGNKRVCRMHQCTNERALLGPLFGFRNMPRTKKRANPFYLIPVFLIFLNHSLSQYDSFMEDVMRLPNVFLWPYLLFISSFFQFP